VRIAIVTHRFVKGDGQGRVNYEVARRAAGAGHRVTLLASDVAPDLLALPNVAWVRIAPPPLPTALLRHHAFAVRTGRWVRANRHSFDVVQGNGACTTAPVDVSAAHFVHAGWLRSGRYAPGRGARGAYQRLYTAANVVLERRAFAAARTVVAVSAKVAGELAAVGVEPARIRVIHNGVDTSEFRPGPADRRGLGLPEGVFLALFAGDLRTYRKNLDTVLRAMLAAPDVHLAVAGDAERSPFPATAGSLGVGDRVRFLGARRDMPALMRAADAFVFPSRYEPSGLVLLEALASGLPVATVRTAGAAELVTPECGVVLDDPEDAGALARALRALAADPDRRAAMSRAAVGVARGLSWEAMADRYLGAYAEAAGRAPAVAGARAAAPAAPTARRGAHA
jgi:glycosyltransferase involved in cell wall biosynthesis